MLQQPLFGSDPPPSAVRPKKAASRKPAPAPDPFPTYRQTQATIKELRDQVKQLKKDSTEKAAINKDAGNQIARTQKQLADAQKRQTALARKNAELEARIKMYMNMVYEQMTWQSGKAAIPADMLGRLIRLAHPDKHGGSAAANEATAWLLKQRS